MNNFYLQLKNSLINKYKDKEIWVPIKIKLPDGKIEEIKIKKENFIILADEAVKSNISIEQLIMEIFTELNLTNQQKVAYLSRLNLNNGKMVDVGVDTDLANFYPILMEDLIDYTKVLNYTKNVDL